MKSSRKLLAIARPESGQSYVLLAFSFVVLLLFSGLVIDAGMIFVAQLQLSRAVDAAALASAPEASQSGVIDTAVDNRAQQFLRANNMDLFGPVSYTLSIPAPDQVKIDASRTVSTTFIKLIGLATGTPAFQTVRVAASATAEYSAYSEIPIKPTGGYGSESAVNTAIWGPHSMRTNGDPYSPLWEPAGTNNPEHAKLPNGYIYRISVPADYIANWGSNLRVELFDPDNFNKPYAVMTAGQDCRVSNASNTTTADPNVNLSAVPFPCYFRIDEYRNRVDTGAQERDTTQFRLWYLDPLATSILHADPSEVTTIASYVTDGADTARNRGTDLQWVLPDPTNPKTPSQPPLIMQGSFLINLSNYAAMPDGTRNFYLTVSTTDGASENNFDIRSGPSAAIAPEIDLTAGSKFEYSQSYTDTATSTRKTTKDIWQSGGTFAYAVRAMPINFNTLAMEARYLSFIPPEAAGQKILVRHFDNDYGAHPAITYYLKDVPTAVWSGSGNLSGGNQWYGNNGTYTGDLLTLPPVGSSAWVSGTQTVGRWLTVDYQAPFSQDTSVWEVFYPRVRLVN